MCFYPCSNSIAQVDFSLPDIHLSCNLGWAVLIQDYRRWPQFSDVILLKTCMGFVLLPSDKNYSVSIKSLGWRRFHILYKRLFIRYSFDYTVGLTFNILIPHVIECFEIWRQRHRSNMNPYRKSQLTLENVCGTYLRLTRAHGNKRWCKLQ